MRSGIGMRHSTTAKGQRKRQGTAVKPSKKQVGAWLATVLAPMSEALDYELERSERSSWSFRCGPRDFEFLSSTERMLQVQAYVGNRDQMFRFFPVIKDLATQHDDKLAALRKACNEAYDRLVLSEEFARLASSARDSSRRYLAEYVINGIRDLHSDNSSHDFWRENGDKFLALREEPPLAPSFMAVLQAGNDFRDAVRSLRGEVKRLQQELADAYGLPVVEPRQEV